MSDRIYCYPDSDVLINKLNIRNSDRLQEAERKLTMLRIHDLLETPLKGKFDFKHLKNIHGYIFQDIYSWAGNVRNVDIAKSNMFCKVQYIEEQASDLFGKLKLENYLNDLSREDFIRRAAYYFSEINALHPFREGNGRSQREFIRELAFHQGYVVSFDNISEREMLEASSDSFLCNYDKMIKLFDKVVH